MNISVFFVVLSGLVIFVVSSSLILYFIGAFGLYRIAENRKIKDPWMAFIPLANFYILGRIVEPIKIFNKEVPNLPFFLLGSAISVIVLGYIPPLGQLAFLVFLVLTLFSLYNLYNSYTDKAVLYLVISVLIPFSPPILIFYIRNRKYEDIQQI